MGSTKGMSLDQALTKARYLLSHFRSATLSWGTVDVTQYLSVALGDTRVVDGKTQIRLQVEFTQNVDAWVDRDYFGAEEGQKAALESLSKKMASSLEDFRDSMAHSLSGALKRALSKGAVELTEVGASVEEVPSDEGELSDSVPMTEEEKADQAAFDKEAV